MGSKSYSRAFSVGIIFRFFLTALIFLTVFVSAVYAEKAMDAPDVLVLVAYGLEKQQVAISYTSDIPINTAQKDLDYLMKRKWIVENPNATIESVEGSNSRPTTSVTFYTPNVIDVERGIINTEPFVEALKRFKTVEIICIGVPNMEYAGSTAFENKFVKMEGSVGTNSYRYKVKIKDAGFDRLDFPKKERKISKTDKTGGAVSGLPRIMLIIGIALFCAVAVYFVALIVAKRSGIIGGRN